MDDVIGHKPATKPPIVIESSVEEEQQQQGNDSLVEETDSVVSDTPAGSTSHDSETPVSRSRESEKDKATPNSQRSKKRRKVHVNNDQAEVLVEKMMKFQEESDRH